MTYLRELSLTQLCLSVVLMVFGLSASAQSTLTSKDGSFKVEGTLTTVNSKSFVIETDLGEFTFARSQMDCSGVGCPDGDTATGDSAAVVLTSSDGQITLEGTLIETTDAEYLIATDRGNLRVRRESVSCEGLSCPDASEFSGPDVFSAAGPEDGGVDMLRKLVRLYSDTRNLKVGTSISGRTSIDLSVKKSNGTDIALVSAIGQNTRNAIMGVIDGRTSFALTRERMTPKQLSKWTRSAIGSVDDVLVEHRIGVDALSFVTHPDNPAARLSMAQVEGIMSAQIQNWSEVGGPDAPISVHSLALRSGLVTQLNDRLIERGRVGVGGRFTFHKTLAGLNDGILSDPNSFGVVYSSQLGKLRPVEISTTCGILHRPTDFAVQSGDYPFSFGWYLYATKGADQSAFEQEFISFIRSNAGQTGLASMGLRQPDLALQSIDDEARRVLINGFGNDGNQVLAQYLNEIRDSSRLSVALRFKSGSSDPDLKAIEDIARIAALLEDPNYAGYEIKLIGFSDAAGDFEKNVDLSKDRAEAIKQLLLSQSNGRLSAPNVQVIGAGPIAPTECNDREHGKRQNRRVEVWLTRQAS